MRTLARETSNQAIRELFLWVYLYDYVMGFSLIGLHYIQTIQTPKTDLEFQLSPLGGV